MSTQWKTVQAALGTEQDGIPGPNDRAAFERLFSAAREEFRASIKVPKPEQPAPSDFIGWLIRIASQEVGTRETSKNNGPGIAKYWTATSYPDGYANREPYCAAFLCWVVSQAVKASGSKPAWKLPTSARAFDWDEHWAPGNKLNVLKYPDPAKIKAGDILVFSFSHIGLCVGRDGSQIITIEGNTNAAGSREGDGVHRKTRVGSAVRSAIRLA